ncbi:MAG: protein translocase subunit SecD [Terriglobia bacterium]
MEKSIRNRALVILGALILCAVAIIGLPKNIGELKQNVRDHIRLGLDLKGGTHLVVQVHVEDAVNVTTDETLERLKDELKKRTIPYADVEKADSTHLALKGIPQEKSQDIQALATEQFSDWDLSRVAGDPTGRILSLKVSAAAGIRTSALEQAMNTISNRINRLGIAEPTIAEYGKAEDYELVIELPGLDDPTRVRDIIQAQAMLKLSLVEDGPYSSKEAALEAHGGILPPDSELLSGSGSPNGGQSWYVLNKIAAITGRDLSPGGSQPSHDEQGRPSVNFNLTRDGAQRFGRVTGQNVGKLLAIILDNRVVEAPEIHSQINDHGEITGTFTPQQTQDLSLVLNSGALPASISIQSEEVVGPSLGADSIRHGIVASIVGFVAVMLFMLVYYKGAGINADLALILNLIILVAAFAYFGATLTLPGIAGVILTVGMGVDSNVLIFERIREEWRGGKAVGAAVVGGFEHAFKTIIDTHVTTVASAVILFTFGTGPIKGFAVTLTIGLLANLFTSVFVSRVIFDWVLTKHTRGEPLSI